MHTADIDLDIIQGWSQVLNTDLPAYENIGEFVASMWGRKEQMESAFWAESEKDILRSIGFSYAERGVHLLLIRV